jgi:hypothetical protein
MREVYGLSHVHQRNIYHLWLLALLAPLLNGTCRKSTVSIGRTPSASPFMNPLVHCLHARDPKRRVGQKCLCAGMLSGSVDCPLRPKRKKCSAELVKGKASRGGCPALGLWLKPCIPQPRILGPRLSIVWATHLTVTTASSGRPDHLSHHSSAQVTIHLLR